jgi:hypothetical protein
MVWLGLVDDDEYGAQVISTTSTRYGVPAAAITPAPTPRVAPARSAQTESRDRVPQRNSRDEEEA